MRYNFVPFQTLGREFLLRVSFLEIYNENVIDLLGDPKKFLEIREEKVLSDLLVH